VRATGRRSTWQKATALPESSRGPLSAGAAAGMVRRGAEPRLSSRVQGNLHQGWCGVWAGEEHDECRDVLRLLNFFMDWHLSRSRPVLHAEFRDGAAAFRDVPGLQR
jgi:hypothetical protein